MLARRGLVENARIGLVSPLEERIRGLQARIRKACETAERDPGSVELLPVSKFQDIALVREAASLGFHRFGENYVQEGVARAKGAPDLDFLLIGPLQRNKARLALQTFREILTLDRPELAQRLGRIVEEEGWVRPVWIQVDLWDEATKAGGCPQAGLDGLLEVLGQHPALPLQGFMALPPPGLTAAFQQLATLRERYEQRLGTRLKLSMGMSGDLEAAIAAGSDQIRIGTGFFGSRT